MIKGIDIVSVWVLDQDTAKDFYTTKLGFTATNDVQVDNGMRWLTVRAPGSTGQEFLLMDPSGNSWPRAPCPPASCRPTTAGATTRSSPRAASSSSSLRRGDSLGSRYICPVAESGKDLTLRASHEDRDRVIEQLRVAAGDGRLTMAELDERIEQASAARTYAELATVTSDLPADPSAPRPVAPAAQAKDLVRIDLGSGHTRRDGHWVVPKRMEIKCRSGHVQLDFTEAVITEPVLYIDTDLGSGQFRLITKPGIVVDADDLSVRNGQVAIRTPWGEGVRQTLRIEVSGKIRSGHLHAAPRPRNFWQWLTRKPRPWELPAA